MKPNMFRSNAMWKSYSWYCDSARSKNLAPEGDFLMRLEIAYIDAYRLIEVELIEPMLFFDFFPETVDVFADHIERFLRRSRDR